MACFLDYHDFTGMVMGGKMSKKLAAFFENFGTVNTPTCSKCRKKVEQFGFTYDEKLDRIVGTAKCHNESESYSFDFHKLMRMATKAVKDPTKKRVNKIIISDAFKYKGRLEDGKRFIEL